MGTIDNADITVYWRRAALSDNFPTGRYSDAFQKISLHRQRPGASPAVNVPLSHRVSFAWANSTVRRRRLLGRWS